MRVERGTSSGPTKANGDQEMQPIDSPTVETKPGMETSMDIDQPPADQIQEKSTDKDKEAKNAGEGVEVAKAAKVAEKEVAPETTTISAPAPMQADDDDAVEY